MASAQATAELVRQVCEFIDVSEIDALVLLKKSNNDINRAIDTYFQDPVGSIREEMPAHQWSYQDHLPYADDASTGALPPLSRPPSRVDDGRNIIDLTAQHAAATASTTKTLKEQEDTEDSDLQRAMALSMGQEVPEQENGVTGTGQQFGPALRPHYEESQWAVAPVASSREVIDHPPASKRRRVQDEPAFLRGSKETGYLGPLLTIYHGIPLAREALLLPSMRIMTFGYDPNWWSGSSDENSKALSLETDQNVDTAQTNLLAEVQCLMAFLDNTTRAYGSVDALADLFAYKAFPSETTFSRFLEAWGDAALRQSPQEQLTQIFTSIAIKDPRIDHVDPIEKTLVCLEPPVNRIEGQLLVDLLDSTVWNDSVDNMDDVWIQHCAEVFTMHLFDPGNLKDGLNLTTTAVWYPDRYMFDCRAQTQQMRKEMQVIRKQISHYTSIQRRCEVISGPDRRPLRIKEVLEAVSIASTSVAAERPASSSVLGSTSQLAPEEIHKMEREIQSMLRRIDDKLQLLEQRKDELHAQMRQIALQLTQQSTDPAQPPYRKYLLQGVSTKPEITYLRRRSRDLLRLNQEDGDHSANEWQWWRISWTPEKVVERPVYPTVGPVTQAQAEAVLRATGGGKDTSGFGADGESAPYHVKPVTEQDVIDAAKTEHNSVVLVYANENAMQLNPSSVPQALRQFVEQDNHAFARELSKESEQEQGAKDSEDSFEHVPLMENQPLHSAERELTPMSASSQARDEDGQPSPKRPKSSEEAFRSVDDSLPSYEESVGAGQPEMQERRGNKIGLYAERMLERYGETKTAGKDPNLIEGMHIEHPTDLPR